MTSIIFKPNFIQTPHPRYVRDEDFLSPMIAQEVEEKIKDHARVFKKTAVITPPHLHWPFDGDRYAPAQNMGLPESTYDLILHLHALHAANDVVGQLIQSRLALKPDGVVIVAFLGGESLSELRKAIMQAEIDLENGASQRIAPMIDLRDAGGLLGRAGFALPVADNWPLNVKYQNVKKLIHDLRKLGLSHPLATKTRPISKSLFKAINKHYPRSLNPKTPMIEASFELIFLTAHAPSETQPKPLKPGSVTLRLNEAINKAKKL